MQRQSEFLVLAILTLSTARTSEWPSAGKEEASAAWARGSDFLGLIESITEMMHGLENVLLPLSYVIYHFAHHDCGDFDIL